MCLFHLPADAGAFDGYCDLAGLQALAFLDLLFAWGCLTDPQVVCWVGVDADVGFRRRYGGGCGGGRHVVECAAAGSVVGYGTASVASDLRTNESDVEARKSRGMVKEKR